jgi:myo-inositol 2-dehydrogenase/D-chiro-inositol 1-dehydrogenase
VVDNRPHSIAFVGTGDWAREALAPALRSIPGNTFVACVGPDEQQVQRFAVDMDVARSYPELGAMLGAERGLDLLVISTPDDHHPVAIGAAAAAGVAVFCEKPLANSAAVAESLAATAAAAGIEATVGYSFRYSAAVQRLRDDLRSGALGEPWLLELHEHNAQFHPVVGR